MPDVTTYFNTHPDNMLGYTFTGSQKHTTEISTGKYSCEGVVSFDSEGNITENIYFPVLDFGVLPPMKDKDLVVKKNLEGDTNFGDIDTIKDLKYIVTGVKRTFSFTTEIPTTKLRASCYNCEVDIQQQLRLLKGKISDASYEQYEHHTQKPIIVTSDNELICADDDADPIVNELRKNPGYPNTWFNKADESGSYLTYDSKYIDGGRIIDGPTKE